MPSEIIVLDAGAFYAGVPFLSSSQRFYTTSAVFDEVRHIKASTSALEALLQAGRLAILDPDQKYLDRVRETASQTGDRSELSAPDISVLALAMQLAGLLVTDDYTVSNVASVLGVAVKPATAGKEIRESRKSVYYCSGCARTFRANQTECPFCGNRLRKKSRRIRAQP